MGQAESSPSLASAGTDFTRVNGLRPVRAGGGPEGGAEGGPGQQRGRGRELSPSLTGSSTMYQGLRSYVGK